MTKKLQYIPPGSLAPFPRPLEFSPGRSPRNRVQGRSDGERLVSILNASMPFLNQNHPHIHLSTPPPHTLSAAMSNFPPPNGLSLNPNHTHHHHHLMDHHLDHSDFDISDYLIPNNSNGTIGEFTSTYMDSSYRSQDPSKEMENSVTHSGDTPSSSNTLMKCKHWEKKVKKDFVSRIAFRMKSELEIIDDGFKWRKYGKKKVKNSPNPRNYYRCSSQGCNVKKRVERDVEDSSYVITTYDGVHNHESPCVIYYNETPLMVPSGWTLQASHSPS